jgi:hypothetical protein
VSGLSPLQHLAGLDAIEGPSEQGAASTAEVAANHTAAGPASQRGPRQCTWAVPPGAHSAAAVAPQAATPHTHLRLLRALLNALQQPLQGRLRRRSEAHVQQGGLRAVRLPAARVAVGGGRAAAALAHRGRHLGRRAAQHHLHLGAHGCEGACLQLAELDGVGGGVGVLRVGRHVAHALVQAPQQRQEVRAVHRASRGLELRAA